MARNYQPQRNVGPFAWRGLQLLGSVVGFVGFGASISAEDVAFASLATVLQSGVVVSSGPADVVRGPVNGPHACHAYRGGSGSCLYSLALCSGELCEGAWRSMEMSSVVRSLAVLSLP